MSEIHEIWRHNICPHIILKNIWTIKSIIYQRFFYFSSTCCMSYTWNHSKYPSFNIISILLYHFHVETWDHLLIECLLFVVAYLQFLVDTRIVYEFNCILTTFWINNINTQIALEINEILWRRTICPRIILKMFGP